MTIRQKARQGAVKPARRVRRPKTVAWVPVVGGEVAVGHGVAMCVTMVCAGRWLWHATRDRLQHYAYAPTLAAAKRAAIAAARSIAGGGG